MPSEPAWRVWLDLEGRPGFQNMAIDQALLGRAGRGERWLRLYRWLPHCLSFGRHEPATRRYDRARIAALGLDVVRRPTGGRAVWHAEELTYAIAVPADTMGGLQDAYREIHQMLQAGLRRLGIAAQMAPARKAAGVGAGACFAAPAGGELVIGERKAVGSAQLREGEGLLQHGSILLHGRQTMVGDLTLGAAPPDLAGSLAEAAGGRMDLARAAEAIAAAAAARWRGAWSQAADAEMLVAEASAHEPRFRSPEWTWKA